MHRNASTLTHREGNASTVDPEPARVQGSVCDLWRVEVEVPHARLVNLVCLTDQTPLEVTTPLFENPALPTPHSNITI